MKIDMKMEKMSQKALERKSNKPIMEKKRRARINHCLNQLKALILETDNERSRHSKLEKADILEMTVRYLQTLRAYHLHLTQLHQINNGSQSTSPTNLSTTSSVSGSPPAICGGASPPTATIAVANTIAAMQQQLSANSNQQQQHHHHHHHHQLLQLQNHFQSQAQISPHQLQAQLQQLQQQLPLNQLNNQNNNNNHLNLLNNHQQSLSPQQLSPNQLHQSLSLHNHLNNHNHHHQSAQISPTWRPW